MAKIKIGSIGLGSISQGNHLPGIERSKDLELTAICDIDEAKLQKVGEQYGIGENLRFTDYRELINCPAVEAVDISAPNNLHFRMAMDAAAAGKPYCLEKPVTMTAEEADILAERTREAGVKNMVCFSYRFMKAARFMKDLIKKGAIGEIYHVDMQYFQAWGLPEWQGARVWRFVREIAGSGALGDLGCHALDLVRFVIGREYTKVVGHTGTYTRQRKIPGKDEFGEVAVDDFCNYMAEMDGGVSASFQITRCAYGRGNYQRMEIYGGKGAIVYCLDRVPNEDEVEVCIGDVYHQARAYTKLPVPDKYKSDQMQSFADIVNDKGDGLAADIFDGRKNQHVLDAVLASAAEGVWKEL